MEHLHHALKRQLLKHKISAGDLNESLQSLLLSISEVYKDADQLRYIKERALEISSVEMQELNETIQQEKQSLQVAYDRLIEKDKELKRQRNYASSLIKSVSDMLIVIDHNYVIKDINSSAVRTLGYQRELLIDSKFDKLIINKQPIDALIEDINHLKSNDSCSFTTEIICKDKKTIPILISASTIQNEENVIQCIICIAKDISELKNLEKENTEKMVLLTHAGRLAALGEMATGIAHELNQPLSIIKTNIQTLEFMKNNLLSQEDIDEILQSVIRQVNRAAYIINHMRNFSRKEQGQMKNISIIQPIDDAIGMFNEQFRLHNIEIIRNYEENLPLIYAEPQQLEQLVVNLLSNARYAVEKMSEYLSGHLKITLTLKYIEKDKTILFQVQDNGIGMVPEVLNHCFDAFYTTKEIGEGTGLGLVIVRNIIKNLNGDIHISSFLRARHNG